MKIKVQVQLIFFEMRINGLIFFYNTHEKFSLNLNVEDQKPPDKDYSLCSGPLGLPEISKLDIFANIRFVLQALLGQFE